MKKQMDKLKEKQLEILHIKKEDIILPKEIELYYWEAVSNLIEGNYLEAWDDFQKIYEILKRNKQNEILFYIYNGMGVIARELEDYMGALDFFERAAAVLKKYPNERMYCIIQNNIGDVYMCIRNYKKAIFYFNRANNLEREAYKYTNGISALNLGIAYRKLGQLKKAKQYLEYTLEIMKKAEYYRELEIIYENLVCLYYQVKNYRKVIFYLSKVLEYLEDYVDIEAEGHYEERENLIEILYELGEESVLVKRLWNDYRKNEKINHHNNCRSICHIAITYAIKQECKELLPVLYDRYHCHSQKHRELVKIYQEKSAGFQRRT